jgi:hypothetical protein
MPRDSVRIPCASCQYRLAGMMIKASCDNAPYRRANLGHAYLEHSRIDVPSLPTYAADLNLIAGFWKFFNRQVLYNRLYETCADYKAACKRLFADIDAHAAQLHPLLTENFGIIRA